MITQIDKSLNSFSGVLVAWNFRDKAREMLFAIFLLAVVFTLACEKPKKVRNVIFVDRTVVFVDAGPVERPLLVIGINEDRRLSLNKFAIGTMAETSILAEKLRGLFEDRRRAGVNEKEVIIEMRGAVQSADLEKLLEMLESVEASSIRIIRGDH